MYEMGQAEIDAVTRVIKSRQLFRYRGGEGGECDQFEAGMRKMLGTEYFLMTTSGTAALICGLVGMEIGPGDEVILPAYTFMATGLAVLNLGAVPVLAEVDESLTIDVADVERKVTPRTRAIIPVDMVGLPCDMDALMSLSDRHGIPVLEDACQAIGGSYKGKKIGAIGKAGAFSFNQFKIISCGEGGGLATNDRRLYERALIYHDGGSVFRSYAGELTVPFFAGDNYRASEVMGAIMNAQLPRLDSILARLRERRAAMVAILGESKSLEVTPSHDPAGECGSTVSMLFKTAVERKRVADAVKAANAAYNVPSPIDSGRHVYTNWSPFIERRGSYHTALDTYRRPENAGASLRMTKDCCPRTLDILARTAFVFPDLDHDVKFYEDLAKAIVKAAAPVKSGK